MTCRDITALLGTYADGELDAAQARAVIAHLPDCRSCAAQVARWQRLRRAAHRSISVPVPATLSMRVQNSVAAARRARSGGPQRWLLRISAVAAAVLLAMISSALLVRPDALRRNETIRPLQLAAIHALCAVEQPHDARRIRGSDPALIARKLRQDLDYPACIPNMSWANLRLDGLCTCLQVNDARTVHAFYRGGEDEAAVVSIFSIDRPAFLANNDRRITSRVGPRIYQVGTVGAANVAAWVENNATYAFVAQMPLTELVRLADGVVVGDALAPESAGNIVR